MTIEVLLKNALMLLNTCHVLGADAEKFGGAMKNIDTAVKAINMAKKEVQEDDHHNQQGQSV